MIGRNVKLRPLVRSDLSQLNAWKNDEQVFMYLGGGYNPVSIDQQEKWMDSMIDMTGNNRRFMILDKEENPIGMVGLYDISWIHRTCEIGIYIGESACQRKGYAEEACRLIEGYAEQYLNLRKIKLEVVSENIAAIALWTKLGFTKVGEYKAERFIKGKYYALILMEKFLKNIENGSSGQS